MFNWAKNNYFWASVIVLLTVLVGLSAIESVTGWRLPHVSYYGLGSLVGQYTAVGATIKLIVFLIKRGTKKEVN